MIFSKFLPADFNKDKAITILAGRGIYPVILHEKIKSLGLKVKLIAFEDETNPALYESFDAKDRTILNIGQLGALLKTLKNNDSQYAIMAGQIKPKKLFSGLKPDLKAFAILMTLKEKNAESIFGAIAHEMSKINVNLLDARTFLDDELSTAGFMTGKHWEIKNETLEHGLKIARECARLDIGQSCVISNGTVLSVEAFDGTDKMLERCSYFEARDMLFVKTVKPNQDYRFDVPVIGLHTLDKLYLSKIFNVAVESGNVIMLEKAKLIEKANSLKIKIFGI